MPAITPGQLSDAVGRIYDCAIDPSRWSATLGALAPLFGATFANLNLQAPRERQIRLFAQWGGDPYWLHLLDEKYHALNPFYPVVARAPLGTIMTVSRMLEHMDDESARDSPFIREWAEPAGYCDVVSLIVSKSAERAGIIAFTLPHARGIATTDDVATMALLSPHLRRAVAISDLLEIGAVAAGFTNSLLDALAIGVLFVDTEARLTYANPAAERLLRRETVIRLVDGRLEATLPQADAAIRSAVALAARDGVNIGEAGIGIPLRGQDGTRAVAHVLPLSTGELNPGLAGTASAAIFVAPLDRSTGTAADILSGLFGLTPGEARSMVALAEHGSRAEAAAALGIGVETLKTHAQRVLKKTRLPSHAELMRLTESLRPPVDIG